MHYRSTETKRWITPTLWVDESIEVPSLYSPVGARGVLTVRSDRLAYRQLRQLGATRAQARYRIEVSHGTQLSDAWS